MGAIEQVAIRRCTVTSSAARLLVVALKILGDCVVDNEADVWLVDNYNKGDACDSYLGLTPMPISLNLTPCFGFHTSMIMMSFNTR